MIKHLSQKTTRKVQGKIARRKSVRYHNDATLFPDSVKVCVACQRPFENRKKWASRVQFKEVLYCSKRCRKQTKKTI